MKETALTFIGHGTCYGIDKEMIKTVLRPLIADKGIDTFYSGGMGDFDWVCARAVYELKAEFGKKDTLTLVRDAGDLFMGTVISALPILPSGEDSIAIEGTDFEQTTGPVETMTLSEFEARYGAQS